MTKENIAGSILVEAQISDLDPLTILAIIDIIIKILMYLGDNWKTPNKLPLWKKLQIKIGLIMKFGRKKASDIEAIIYRKVATLTEQEVKSFVEIYEG